MCLIFISLQQHPAYQLIVVANRDEFYARRTVAADYWQDAPDILGGRDMEAGGTWMAVNRKGQIAMVTNYRDVQNLKTVAPSRGHLVADFLMRDVPPQAYLAAIEPNATDYNGFNLIVGDANELWYLSNYKKGFEKIAPGLHALSNNLLDVPWPKTVRGTEKMRVALQQSTVEPNLLLDLMYDLQMADDDQLPDTGLPLERERLLSSMFIKSPGYGSRCSTVVTIDNNNNLSFTERVYDLITFRHQQRTFEYRC
jgi:uncharacterized protein with NRDE domain